jgi:hypothetical protein
MLLRALAAEKPWFISAALDMGDRFVQSFEALLIFISSLSVPPTPKASAAETGADIFSREKPTHLEWSTAFSGSWRDSI